MNYSLNILYALAMNDMTQWYDAQASYRRTGGKSIYIVYAKSHLYGVKQY